MKTRTILPLLVLANVLASAPAQGQGEAVPKLNRRVLQFAADHEGNMVGDGESRTLVNEALKAVGARVQKLSKDDPILPGDVANFNQSKFVHIEGNGSSGTTIVVDDQHAAIVGKTIGPAITLLHQNFPAGHKTVDTLTIDLLEQTEGTVEFFRPISLVPVNSGPAQGGPGGGGSGGSGPSGIAQTPMLLPMLQRVTPTVIRRLPAPQITTLIGVVRLLAENPNLSRAQITSLIRIVRTLLQSPNLTVPQRQALQAILPRLQARARILAAGPDMIAPDELEPDDTDAPATTHDPLIDDTPTCDLPPPSRPATSNGGELMPPLPPPPIRVVDMPPGHGSSGQNSGTSNPPPVHPALCPPGLIIDTFPPEPPAHGGSALTQQQPQPAVGSSGQNSGRSDPTPNPPITIIDTFSPPSPSHSPPPSPPGEASCGENSGTSNPPSVNHPPKHPQPTAGWNSGTFDPPVVHLPPKPKHPDGQPITIVDTKPQGRPQASPQGSSGRNGGSTENPPMVTIPSDSPHNPVVYTHPRSGHPGIHVTSGGTNVPTIVKSVVDIVKTALPPPPHPACNKADIQKIAKRCEEERRRQQAAASHNIPTTSPAYASFPANGRSHIQALAQSGENERRQQAAIAEYNRRKAAWDDYQRQVAAYNTPAPFYPAPAQHYYPALAQQQYYSPPMQQYDPEPMPQYYPGYGYDGGGYEPTDHGSGIDVGGLISGIGGLIEGFGGGMGHDSGDE